VPIFAGADRHVHTSGRGRGSRRDDATCAARSSWLPAVAFTEHADFNACCRPPPRDASRERDPEGPRSAGGTPRVAGLVAGAHPRASVAVRTRSALPSGYLDIAGYWRRSTVPAAHPTPHRVRRRAGRAHLFPTRSRGCSATPVDRLLGRCTASRSRRAGRHERPEMLARARGHDSALPGRHLELVESSAPFAILTHSTIPSGTGRTRRSVRRARLRGGIPAVMVALAGAGEPRGNSTGPWAAGGPAPAAAARCGTRRRRGISFGSDATARGSGRRALRRGAMAEAAGFAWVDHRALAPA